MPTFRTEYLSAKAPMVWQTIATMSKRLGVAVHERGGDRDDQRRDDAEDHEQDPEDPGRAALDEVLGGELGRRVLLVRAHEVAGDEQGVDDEQDAGPELEGADGGLVGPRDQVDAHRQRQAVGDAHDDEHDGQQAGVPERQALAVAHREAAVDAGEQDEHAGDDADDPGEHRHDVGGGGAQVDPVQRGTRARSARSRRR